MTIPNGLRQMDESENEVCESGCKEPVTCHDIEGVPLCRECGEDLARGATKDLIKWLLGENGEFPIRQEGQGLYWWRKELRKRAEFILKE